MVRVSGHDEIESLLGAFALDAVDPDEAELVSRHLEICPRCRDEVRQHREVAGLLGYAGQEAPAGLWDRISAGTQEEPPALRFRAVPVEPAEPARLVPDRRRRTLRMRTVAALGAAAAVVVAVLAVQVARLDHRASTISHEAASAPTMSAVETALSTPGARKVVLAPVSTGQSVDAVILPDGRAFLYDPHLAPLPAAQTYQLWGVTDSRAVSYGILGNVPAQVVSFRAADGVQALAITAEAAGGAVTATHAAVVQGAVSPAL